MASSRLLFLVSLILSSSLLGGNLFCAAEVSLKKLFMMMDKQQRQQQQQQQQQQAVQEQQQVYHQEECINPQVVQVIQEELTTAKASRDQVKVELEAFLQENKRYRTEAEKSSQERDTAMKDLAKVRKELEDFRRDTKKTMEQMEQTSDAAQRVAQVQEDFAKRLAQVQTKAQQDLETAQATIVQQTEELLTMKAELSEERANKLDKNVLAREQVKVKALEEEKATLQGELKAIQALYKNLEEKSEKNLSQQHKNEEQAVLEDTARRVAQVQEDYAKRLAQVQTKAQQDLETAQATIAQQTEELQTVKAELSKEQANKLDKTVLASEEAKVKALEEEKATLQGELKASQDLYKSLEEKHERELAQQKSEEEAVEELVTTRLKTELENKEEEMNLKWKKVMQDYERRLGNAYGERNELRASHLKEMEQVRASHKEEVTALNNVYNVTVESKKKLEMQIETMTKTVEELEARVEATKKEMEEVRASHTEEITALNQVLNSTIDKKEELEMQLETMRKTVEELEAKVRATKKEAEYWEASFKGRSYLNWTYVAEGTRSMLHSAADSTGTAIQTTRQVSSRKLNELQKSTSTIDFSTAKKQVSHVTAKYVENTNKLYERHLKEHVDKGIEKARPVYNAHVAPVVKKGVKAATEAREAARKTSDSAFFELSAQFQNACPKVMSGLKEAKEKKGMPVPSGVTDSLQRSCQDPEGSVRMFLRAMAVLFAIIFHRTLWRFLVWSIRVIFSPVLFLFGRSRKEEQTMKQEKDQVDEQKASEVVKVEQNQEQEKNQMDEQKASKGVNGTNGTTKNGRTKARKNGVRTRSSRKS